MYTQLFFHIISLKFSSSDRLIRRDLNTFCYIANGGWLVSIDLNTLCYIVSGDRLVYKECLLHSLKQAPRGIGLYINLDKIEFMHFEQDGAISILDNPLIVDYFPYLGSNIASTERHVSICIGKT